MSNVNFKSERDYVKTRLHFSDFWPTYGAYLAWSIPVRRVSEPSIWKARTHTRRISGNGGRLMWCAVQGSNIFWVDACLMAQLVACSSRLCSGRWLDGCLGAAAQAQVKARLRRQKRRSHHLAHEEDCDRCLIRWQIIPAEDECGWDFASTREREYM